MQVYIRTNMRWMKDMIAQKSATCPVWHNVSIISIWNEFIVSSNLGLPRTIPKMTIVKISINYTIFFIIVILQDVLKLVSLLFSFTFPTVFNVFVYI